MLEWLMPKPLYLLLLIIATLNLGCATTSALRPIPAFDPAPPQESAEARQKSYAQLSISDFSGSTAEVGGVWYDNLSLRNYAANIPESSAKDLFKKASKSRFLASTVGPGAPVVGAVIGTAVILVLNALLPYAAAPNWGSIAAEGAAGGGGVGAVIGVAAATWGLTRGHSAMRQGVDDFNCMLRFRLGLETDEDKEYMEEKKWQRDNEAESAKVKKLRRKQRLKYPES